MQRCFHVSVRICQIIHSYNLGVFRARQSRLFRSTLLLIQTRRQNNRPQLFVQLLTCFGGRIIPYTLKKNVSKKAMNHNLGTWDVPPLRLFVTIIKWLHPISCLCLASWPTCSSPKHHTFPPLFSTLSYPLTHPSECVIMSPIWPHTLGVGPSRQKHTPIVVDSSIPLP